MLGGTIIVLATAQDGYLGFSGAVLALTGWLAHLVGHPLDLVPKMTDDILWRARSSSACSPAACSRSFLHTVGGGGSRRR